MSAAVKGVFECKYDNKNFNKNITYFICKMTWLHVCFLSITLTSNYSIGVAKAFVGIMLVLLAKSGKEIYWLKKTEGVTNNTV